MENIIAAAANAAGPINDYQEWLRTVIKVTTDLQRIASAFQAHEQRKAEALALESDGTRKRFTGKLVDVKKINKGNNVIKGYLQFEARPDSNNVDEDGYEFIETAPLYTTEGKFEYNNALNLKGKTVVVYKKLIPLANGRKARECVAVEAA